MWKIFNKQKNKVTLVKGIDSVDTTEEHAKIIDWTPEWDTGAPMPQVFSNGRRTFLIYLISDPDPEWDGTFITTIDNRGDNKYSLALVEFIRAGTYRFGTVNDESAGGHPLYNKGLNYYSAHIVENSKWIKEIKQIHKVHPQFNESNWINRKHFLLFFHDEMFEVIAEDYKIEVFKTTFMDLALEVVKRINS